MVGLRMDAPEIGGIHFELKDVKKPVDALEFYTPDPGEGDGTLCAEKKEEKKGNDVDIIRVSDTDCRELAEYIKENNEELPSTTEDEVEDEVVDISPSGTTLTALALMKQEVASRFKNIYVYDNTFPVLPASIRDFKHVRKLKYFSNEVKILPDEVGELTQLEHLCLKMSPTGLGSLPPLGKLSGLRALELHQAPAPPSADTLTPEIAQLHSLTRLCVCHFSICWVPAEIGSLINLEELDLSFNKLRALPKEISGLKALKTLRVVRNKLVELPRELSSLPNLSSIDVAHNRLTSLRSLVLQSMISLRALNVQFNKLQSTGHIPEWVSCQLEGNEKLEATGNGGEEASIACSEDYLLDWELLPSALDAVVKEANHASSELGVPSGKENSSTVKASAHLKSRRGWRKQDNQQYQARQERLNSSRKHRPDDHSADDFEPNFVDRNTILNSEDKGESSVMVSKGTTEVKAMPPMSSSGDDNVMDLQQICKLDEYAVDQQQADAGDRQCISVSSRLVSLRQDLKLGKTSEPDRGHDHGKPSAGSANKVEHQGGGQEVEYQDDVDQRTIIDKNRCRKAISGDRSTGNEEEESLVECQVAVEKGQQAGGSSKTSKVIEEVGLRRQGSDTDRNPKPSKRRRSAQDFSEVSYKYFNESICGFNDRLPDGFYDAGRDRPFCSLEVLEKEPPSFDSREVILVDRERDEELDVITLSAQQLLKRLGSSVGGESEKRAEVADIFQRITMLALFVSDCFGGSDKTQNITNMRRAALGGTAGAAFVCSCGSNISTPSSNKYGENTTGSLPGGAVLPSVHLLCEGAVRYLKATQGSNVLPLGSLQYGVCRHRAILLKGIWTMVKWREEKIQANVIPQGSCFLGRMGYFYIRADPVIPCELVRGYLDYMPHAWNVILVESGSGSVRMLVDGCRPLDIRHESDPEYFCRYIPLKRFHMPLVVKVGQMAMGSDMPSPALHEEIGRGASGAIVRRCTFGTFTAAAKVRQLEGGGEASFGKGPHSSCLSELRILCSLRQHPCLVSFYGHQFATLPGNSSQLIIYMELIQGGSLEGLLQDIAKKGQTSMPPKLACQVARDIACALGLLHSRGILHRDIKSSNVLVDLDAKQSRDGGPTVKLCDFDSAVPLSSSSAHTCYLAHRGVPSTDVCVGTPRWIAPEVLRAMYEGHTYGLEADLWSFGCLLVELLTLKVPYAGLLETEVHSCIQMGQRPQLPCELDNLVSQAYISSDTVNEDTNLLRLLVSLFYSCTEASPSQRPTAKEVFTVLSDISGSPPAAVDPPFQVKASNDSVKVQVAGPNVLRPLATDNVEVLTSSEVNILCSCGGKNCNSCEKSSAPYVGKSDKDSVNTQQI